MNAYVRLNEVDQGPAYFQTATIKTVTTYGGGSRISTGDDFQIYSVQETPDEIYTLIREAEADRILKQDEIEFIRSEAMKERDNASIQGV